MNFMKNNDVKKDLRRKVPHFTLAITPVEQAIAPVIPTTKLSVLLEPSWVAPTRLMALSAEGFTVRKRSILPSTSICNNDVDDRSVISDISCRDSE